MAARFEPTASMTARVSSIRVSRSGIRVIRRERPVPRLSKRIRRKNEASLRKKSAGGPSHATSSEESTHPAMNTRSIGPSPTTEYAILTSPLFAYRTSGASALMSFIDYASSAGPRGPSACGCRPFRGGSRNAPWTSPRRRTPRWSASGRRSRAATGWSRTVVREEVRTAWGDFLAGIESTILTPTFPPPPFGREEILRGGQFRAIRLLPRSALGLSDQETRDVTPWWCLLMESRYDQGLRVRKEVLGAEHVARAQEQTTAFDADFQRFLT